MPLWLAVQRPRNSRKRDEAVVGLLGSEYQTAGSNQNHNFSYVLTQFPRAFGERSRAKCSISVLRLRPQSRGADKAPTSLSFMSSPSFVKPQTLLLRGCFGLLFRRKRPEKANRPNYIRHCFCMSLSCGNFAQAALGIRVLGLGCMFLVFAILRKPPSILPCVHVVRR